jgi:hypothetical protein
MKRIVLMLLFVAGMAGVATAQVDGKALGLRFGNAGEISYLHPLSDVNRIELDLGFGPWNQDALYLNGIYQWVHDFSSFHPGFNWYYGVGGALGFLNNYGDNNVIALTAGLVGNIGIEYNFDFPLQLSLDWRPGLYAIPKVRLGWDGIALSARWRF